eukprot:1058438-Pyramimonas_sp.AAC.1
MKVCWPQWVGGAAGPVLRTTGACTWSEHQSRQGRRHIPKAGANSRGCPSPWGPQLLSVG